MRLRVEIEPNDVVRFGQRNKRVITFKQAEQALKDMQPTVERCFADLKEKLCATVLDAARINRKEKNADSKISAD